MTTTKPKTRKAQALKTPCVMSQYERCPLPFFAAKDHSTWAVQPTGDYCEDYETGKAYALEFLKSCDGTFGWCELLPQIAVGMVVAGPTGARPDGKPMVNGVVIGFMGTIGQVLCGSGQLLGELQLRMAEFR